MSKRVSFVTLVDHTNHKKMMQREKRRMTRDDDATPLRQDSLTENLTSTKIASKSVF